MSKSTEIKDFREDEACQIGRWYLTSLQCSKKYILELHAVRLKITTVKRMT